MAIRFEDPAITMDEISEELAAAEYRRDLAIRREQKRCAEQNQQVQQVKIQQALNEKQTEKSLEKSINEELEEAHTRVQQLRAAQLKKMEQEEARHEDVLDRQHDAFEKHIQELNTKYTDAEGNRNRVLSEMQTKLKEHNDRVIRIRDEMRKSKGQPEPAGTSYFSSWLQAAKDRLEYIFGAKDEIHKGDFKLGEASNTTGKDAGL